jgi:transposase
VSAVLRGRGDVQSKYEMVLLEDLVPQDHLLRKIQAILDTDFIRERTARFYSKVGRPAVDPVVLVKMELIAYLYGIRSDRRLAEEIRLNIAYRWFLGLGLTDPVPHFTTPGKNYSRRWKDSGLFEELFDHVVKQAIDAGYIDGRMIFTDSSHLKANANKRRIAKEGAQGVTLEDVARARERHVAARRAEQEACASGDSTEDDLLAAVNADREAHGLKPLPVLEEEPEPELSVEQITASLTDPEAAMLRREGKPDGFHYLQHRTVDGLHGFTLDVFVTSAAMTDAQVYPTCLKRVDRFKLEVQQAGVDAGYNTLQNLRLLSKRQIEAAVAYRRHPTPKGLMGKWRFKYDSAVDAYRCPAKRWLTYVTTTRDGYRVYRSDPSVCSTCPLLGQCTRSSTKQKVIHRHVHEHLREEAREFLKTELGQYLTQRRRETVERSFADAKELHGLRYARYRGRRRVQHQCLVSALAQNLKKLALLESRRLSCASCV